jgi:hypothetical protein
MVRTDASRNNHRSAGTGPAQGSADLPPSTGWPFAAGSQNQPDESAARWPRPSARPAPDAPAQDSAAAPAPRKPQ